MALGLSLSTLGNLGRVASRGVEQHAQKRQGDADRELAKDMLTASVKGDYDELAGKLQQGFYGDVRPELLDAASQTVSQGLRLKREEEYTKRQKMYEIEGIELEKIQGDTAQYGFMTPDEMRKEARSRARRVVSGEEPGGPSAAGGSRIRGTDAISAMVKNIEGIEDKEEKIERGREAIKRVKDAYQKGQMTRPQYENAISRIENAAEPMLQYGKFGRAVGEFGGAVAAGAGAGSRFGRPIVGAIGGGAGYLGSQLLPDFDWSNLGNIKKGFLGEGIGR